MAAHTYWRLVFREQVNAGLEEFIIHEIEFLETWTGPNTMSGATGTASVSSSFNPALYTAANLIDGDPLTRWISQEDTNYEWFQFVYNTPVEVRAVALTASIQLAFMPSIFDLEWSDDGATWTTVWTGTSDYFTWNPFRQTFLAPVGAPAQVLADLTGTGAGIHAAPGTGTAGGTLEALVSVGAGMHLAPITGTGEGQADPLTSTAGATHTAPHSLRHEITLHATWVPR